jgi:hypothetical protein
MDFEQAANHVRKVINDGYSLQRNDKKSFKWRGPKLHKDLAHVVMPFADKLQDNHLSIEAEQGRDLLDVMIGIAIQVGIGIGLDMSEKKLKLLDKIEGLLAVQSKAGGIK